MSERRTIVIVGGVAGGASAATRARRMNEHANIILIEKNEHVSFANCGMPYFIGGEIENRDQLMVATSDFLRRRFLIDVRVKEKAVQINRARKTLTVEKRNGESYELPYDRLILSPGARAVVPMLPGTNAANVLTLRNLDDMDRIKSQLEQGQVRSAIVVGSGFIGLEVVEQLVACRVKTTLIERSISVLPMMDCEMTDPIREELEKYEVDLHLGAMIESITLDAEGRAVSVRLNSGKEIAPDLVVFGIGVRSNSELAGEAGLELGPTGAIRTNRFMQTSDPSIYAVGDAAEYTYGPTGESERIAMAGPANRSGRIAGQHAATDESEPMHHVQGTAIVRIFGLTVGFTGLTAVTANAKGIDCLHATILAKDHAGYYPGAELMTIKLTYQPDSGRILGAQVIGGRGCDKRLDVIATAMHFGGDVRQLTGVDLAYAPPYGSAKDPIHMAAFVATNQLDGIEILRDADANLLNRKVLDVRTSAEVTARPLAGVREITHIPIDELRERITELGDPVDGESWVIACAVGIRGHLAARILSQNGYQCENLSGGATVRRRAWNARQQRISESTN